MKMMGALWKPFPKEEASIMGISVDLFTRWINHHKIKLNKLPLKPNHYPLLLPKLIRLEGPFLQNYLKKDPFKNLSILNNCRSLQYLDLSHYAKNVTNTDLEFIGKITKLTTLYLIDNKGITDKGLQHIQALTNLKELVLYHAKIGDKSLAIVKNFKELHTLRLGDCVNLTDAGLQQLEKLEHLKDLYLSQCTQITDKGFEHLQNLKNIETLRIIGTKVTDKALLMIKKFKKLRWLDLSNSQLTDNGLIHLRELPCLNELYLNNCSKITKESLQHLKELKNLTTLELNGCTDNELESLWKDLPKLRHLNSQIKCI